MELRNLQETEKFFVLLRPYCTRLIETPSKENVVAFNSVISLLSDEILQELHEYLLIEISEALSFNNELNLSKRVAPEFLTDYLLCMQQIISRIEFRSWELFNRLMSKAIMLIMRAGPEEKDSPISLSDELKMAVVKCINESLKRSTESILQNVFDGKFLQKLGCILYHLQQMFENEKSRELQILSMECLRSFISSFFESPLKNRLQDPLATFVPGISIALVNVATSATHPGTNVIVTAIKTWTEYLVGVFGDNNCSKLELPKSQSADSSGRKQIPLPVKNKEWIKMASEKLCGLMSRIAALDRHSSYKVRNAVAEWAHSLISHCKSSLSHSLSIWLDALISLSVDDYSLVQKYSNDALKDFSQHLNKTDENLMEIINDSLFSLVLKLPNIVKRSDETVTLTVLNQLYGYIHVLGFNIKEFLNSSVHIDKLSQAFLILTEFDTRNVHFVSETQKSEDPASKVIATPLHMKSSRQFLNFDDELIFHKVVLILRLLGKNDNLHILIDHMMDRFHQSSIYKIQSVFIINEILIGYSSCNLNSEVSEDIYSKIKWIIDEFLEPNVWDAEINSSSNEFEEFDERRKQSNETSLITYSEISREGNALHKLNGYVILIYLCIEGIAVCAQLARSSFKLLLKNVLYEVLAKCSSDNLIISDTAIRCLNTIAAACEYNNVTDLIMDNADYLLNSITLKLIHHSMDPKVPKVLHVSLQYGSKEMLNVVEDVVDEMLKCIAELSGPKLVPYIFVLNSFCLAVRKWFPNEIVNADIVKDGDVSEESVLDFILKFHKQKLQSQDFRDIEDEPALENLNEEHFKRDVENNDVENEEDSTIPPPSHIILLSKVLERCGHLLPTSTPLVCYWVFCVVENAIRALRGYDDVLLPSVHKIWAPLSNRFLSDNYNVLKSSFQSMCTLVDVCGDFVKSRILKEVWPKILEMLTNYSKKKIRMESFSPTFKLLKEVLESLGSVAKKIDLDELELDNLASVALVYLEVSQPLPIQMAAKKLLEELLELNPDLMWLKLHDAHVFSINRAVKTRNSFDETILFLLKKLDHPESGNF